MYSQKPLKQADSTKYLRLSRLNESAVALFSLPTYHQLSISWLSKSYSAKDIMDRSC
jgi:hypothetical protein